MRPLGILTALILFPAPFEVLGQNLALPAQTDRTVNEQTTMVVTNTATVAGLSVRSITNRYDFNYSNREALLADGWDFIAINNGAPRNTENTNPPGAISYNQDGPLIVPCDKGDIFGDMNSACNMLFRSLPADWLSVKLNLSFVPTNIFYSADQVHLTLYQDDDNYLEVGEGYGDDGEAISMNTEIAGQPPPDVSPISNPNTNVWFRLDRNFSSGVVTGYTGYYSSDGINWTILTSATASLSNPRLAIWTGGWSSYSPGMPAMNLIQLSIVASPIYSLLDNTNGASIDSNGIITWTPTEAQGPSTNLITTVVWDSGLLPASATNSFLVVVNEINLPPILPAQADSTLTGRQRLVVTNTATDADIPSNSLAYQLSTAPPGAAIDANGVISWVPAINQVPSTNTFTTVVTDYNSWAVNSQHLSATNTFQVVVSPVAVTFLDGNLEAAIRSSLGRPSGVLINTYLAALTSLSACNRQITSLNGLEWAYHLEGLYLNGNAIRDVTPLQGLTQLRFLEMEGNQISGLSPLAGLTNLTSLSLGQNPIVDYSGLSNLTSLTCLSVRTGNLGDLSVLQRSTGLISLSLSENVVSDVSPLAALTNLDCLDLRWNQITNFVLAGPGPANLSQLYLGGNPLSGVPPLQGLPRLTLLNLDDDGICDLQPLASLAKLTYLSLSRNTITNLAVLSQLSGLVNLELRGNSISNLSFITSLSRLSYADLAFNRITNISPLLSLTNLNSLVLAGNHLTDYGSLSGMTSVSNLWLLGNSITNASVLAGLGWLNYLNLDGNNLDTVSPLLSLANLTGLSLSQNPITDYTNLASFSGLTSLRLEHMSNSANCVNDISFLQGLTHLRSLSLDQSRIYDLGAVAALTNLQDLYLRRNHLTDVSVLTNLPQLLNLDISLNCLDLASAGSPGRNVISNLEFWPAGTFASTWPVDTNAASGLRSQQVNVTYIPTNPPPSISTGLTTDWYICADSSSTWQVPIWEDGVPDAELTVTAVSSNPQLALIAQNPLPVTNGVCSLTVIAGSNTIDKSATITLTAVDDVCLVTSMVLPVQVVQCEKLLHVCPGADTNLLQQIASLREKNSPDLANADCLMLTNLALYDVNLTDDCIWQYLTNLTVMSASGSYISNLPATGNFSKLNTLLLQNTAIADFSSVARMTSLVDLVVDGSSVSNVCSLRNMTGLTSLQLCNDHLTDISCLSGLTNLVNLALANNALTDLSVLTNLSQLETVDVRYNLLGTNDPTFMGVIATLNNRGVVVKYLPQRAAPVIFIPTNRIVPAGWTNTISYYIQENGVNCGTNVSCGFDWTNQFSASPINTSYDWVEWWLIAIPPNVATNTDLRLWLFATNDVGQVGSNYSVLTVTQPLSLSNQVFAGSNLVWRTGGDAPWFGQTVVTNQSASSAQSGAIGSLQASWLAADVLGPGVLSYWWKVSSETDYDVLTFRSLQQSSSITGEAGWQQQLVSIPAGPQTVQWQYQKTNDRYGTGLDAGWVSDVWFLPVALGIQMTNGELTVSWPGASAFQQATGLAAPWFQTATNLAGPWVNYASSTNSPLVLIPSNSVPTHFFRMRLGDN